VSLYATLLPLIKEHMKKQPGNKVCFTGHSLGGSLATLITMMLVERGELPPELIKPVCTCRASHPHNDDARGERGTAARAHQASEYV
jgi:surfactin synthase thioesterase subunit